MALMSKRLPLIKQLLRFGIVGALAAVVHFSIVVIFVQTHMLQPLTANIFAFLVAFQVSYWGHRQWTFQGTQTSHRVAFSKLFLVGSVTFIANEGLFYFFLLLNFSYPVALFLVLLILPLANFLLGKFWVFKEIE